MNSEVVDYNGKMKIKKADLCEIDELMIIRTQIYSERIKQIRLY